MKRIGKALFITGAAGFLWVIIAILACLVYSMLRYAFTGFEWAWFQTDRAGALFGAFGLLTAVMGVSGYVLIIFASKEK